MSCRFQMEGNTVIRASAGTGKTHALVETAIHLLAGLTHHGRPLAPREVVAITFTEKATGEMLDRIRGRVGALAKGSAKKGDSLLTSAKQLGYSLPDRSHWQHVRREIDQLRVSTFHSFCLALLQRYPLEAGLDPSFGVYDQDASWTRLVDLAELEVLAALQEGASLANLEALIEATGLRSNFEFQPAGLLDRLPGLLTSIHESGLTMSAVRAMLPTSGTREHGLTATLLGLLERIDDRFQKEKLRLARVDFSDMQLRACALLKADQQVRRAVKASIGVLLVDEFQDTNPIQRDLTLLLSETREEEISWSLEAEAVPDDLTLGDRCLFVVGDPKQSIYNFRGAEVSVFSEVEKLLLAQDGQLFSLTTSYRSRPTLVEAGNTYFAELLSWREEEDKPWFVHWTDDAALQAHRSEPFDSLSVHLLDCENWCAEKSKAAKRAQQRGLTQTEELGAVAELVVDIVQGPEPWSVVDGGETRNARFGDITILLRRFKGTLTELTHQLDRRHLPYYIVKGGGFFGAREVADLANALAALSSSADGLSLVAWLRGPMVGISDTALAMVTMAYGRIGRGALRAAVRPGGCAERLGASDRNALATAAQVITEIGRVGEMIGPAQTIRALVDATGYRNVLAALPGGEQALANLTQAEELARQYAERIGPSLAGFADKLRHLVDTEPKTDASQVIEEHQDVVRIMTIHQSKGLDCRIAVVPEAPYTQPKKGGKLLFSRRLGLGVKLENDKDSPRHTEVDTELRSRDLAESRRLMYVAFTRARDHVVLSGNVWAEKVKGSDAIYRAKPVNWNTPAWVSVIQGFKRDQASWLDVIPVERYINRDSTAEQAPPTPPPVDVSGLVERVDATPRSYGGRLVTAVTQLSDFATCARRYWFAWEQGLQQRFGRRQSSNHETEARPEGDRDVDEVSWPADPTDLGTLAHNLLEHVDIAQYRSAAQVERAELLSELARALGVTQMDAEVLAAVESALNGPLGDLMAESVSVEREAGFILYLPGADTELFLRGQIDLLVKPGPDELIHIVDYKYSRPRSGLAFYRFQILSYALAVHRSNGSPVDGMYRAGIAFLKTENPVVRYLDEPVSAEELESFATELTAMGERQVTARHTNCWPRVSADESVAVCRACPFRRICFS